MASNIMKYSGVVALLILAILYVPRLWGSQTTLLGSTSCANITCLSGGLRLVSDAGGDFEVDIASVYNSTVSYLSGFKVGTNGTTFTRMNGGQCFFAPSAATIAASSTKQIDCQATAMVSTTAEAPLPGVSSGDNVVLTLATSTTGTTYLGVYASGCTASTTNGYISCNIFNATGGTFTWPTTGTASGTAAYFVTK